MLGLVPTHGMLYSLQVNRSPSFGTDAPLDYDIKNGVLSDAFKLLNVKYVEHDI